MRRLIPMLALVAFVACAPKTAPNLTPMGLHAYTADQVAVRVGEVQNAAIAAEASGGLPTATTRVIVQFAVGAAPVLKAAPTGWPGTVLAAWTSAKMQIGPVTNPIVSAAMGALDVVIAGVQP